LIQASGLIARKGQAIAATGRSSDLEAFLGIQNPGDRLQDDFLYSHGPLRKKLLLVFALLCAQVCVGQGYFNAPLNGNSAGEQDWTGTDQFFPGLHLGPVFFNQPGTLLANQFPGATFDAQVNACIQAVVDRGGGICDATGLTSKQTILSEIDVGTRTMSAITGNQISVTLLLSPFLHANVNFNSAGACAFKILSESRLIGTGSGITHSAIVGSSGSASMASLVCTDYAAASGQYVAIQGLQLSNSAGGTFTKGLMFIDNTFDASSVRDVLVSNSPNSSLLHVEATCCATVFQNVVLDCSSIAGCIPLQIDSLLGDLQPVLETIFLGISVNHPGAGKSNIQVTHTLPSGLTPCSFSVFGLYMESGSTDTTTPLVNIDSCMSAQFNGVTAQFRSPSSTAVAFHVTHASVSGFIPSLVVTNFQYQNSPIVFPYPAINDTTSGAVDTNVFTDNQGVLVSYMGGQNAATSITFPETGPPTGTKAFDVCRGTSSHTIMCSMSGLPAKALSQTIASGTSSMATGTIGAGRCVAPVTTAASGVATTDAISWSFNAAPGTGYGSVTGSGLNIQPYVTSGNVNFVVCNPTAGSITPAAAILNWRVTR